MVFKDRVRTALTTLLLNLRLAVSVDGNMTEPVVLEEELKKLVIEPSLAA
jgi:hypothetical protein